MSTPKRRRRRGRGDGRREARRDYPCKGRRLGRGTFPEPRTSRSGPTSEAGRTHESQAPPNKRWSPQRAEGRRQCRERDRTSTRRRTRSNASEPNPQVRVAIPAHRQDKRHIAAKGLAEASRAYRTKSRRRRSSAATPGAAVCASHCCDANPSLLDEGGAAGKNTAARTRSSMVDKDIRSDGDRVGSNSRLRKQV